MNYIKSMIVYGILILLGFVLMHLGDVEIANVDWWMGMGSAMIAVAAIRLIRTYRYQKDAAYREKMDIETSDERNRFIRSKAWAYTGYLFFLVANIAVIVLKVMGQDLLALTVGCGVFLMLLIYWISYWFLKKKY